jgi:hypothetical protein
MPTKTTRRASKRSRRMPFASEATSSYITEKF